MTLVARSNQVSWSEAFKVYRKPRVIGMMFLGFAAGLPYMLVFSTLFTWLREEGVSRTLIGFFSWVGITFSIKFLWAPVVDRFSLPVITAKLGKRRSWILLGQLGIACGLVLMAFLDPKTQLEWIAVSALLVAFSSATQDIAVDAYRIEAVSEELQGAMSASYLFGYRVALLTSYTGALFIAAAVGWMNAYLIMAALMAVGILTVLIIREPEARGTKAAMALEEGVHRFFKRYVYRDIKFPAKVNDLLGWMERAIASPLAEFFSRHGLWLALVTLFLVAMFRVSDIVMGNMASLLYIDLGFSKQEIGSITGAYGLVMTLLGAAFGGVAVVRYRILALMLVGALLVAATNLLFAYLSTRGADLFVLTLVISADNFVGGFAVAVFIAYLSGLTNVAYTATQYALFSSLMTLPGKLISGYSGRIVDAEGYVFFFVYASLLGLPAILLIVYLMLREKNTAQKNALSSS